MKIFLLPLILFHVTCGAQVITTVAGNGSHPVWNFVNGVQATACPIACTAGIVTDEAGNFYFAGRNTGYIHKVSAGGIITVIAGDDSAKCFNEEGVPATTFSLNYPVGVTRDATGNIYCSDVVCNRAKKVDTLGMLTSFAGTFGGFDGDGGLAVAAKFKDIGMMATDGSGNVYICDVSNYRIRKISAAGVITTIAGIGSGPYWGEGGAATAARIGMPAGITTDAANNIYFTSANGVRKISNGIITTIAGGGTAGYSGDGGPAIAAKFKSPYGICIDIDGSLYVADNGNNCVRKINTAGIISTIAGTGVAGSSGDGGPATAAQIVPEGVAIDGSGNLYITDNTNGRIRRMVVPVAVDNIFNRKTAYSVYPNPAKDIVSIYGVKQSMRYRLVNIVGAVVKEGSVSEHRNVIEIHSVPAGVYMLELTDTQGQKSVLKIIRE